MHDIFSSAIHDKFQWKYLTTPQRYNSVSVCVITSYVGGPFQDKH